MRQVLISLIAHPYSPNKLTPIHFTIYVLTYDVHNTHIMLFKVLQTQIPYKHFNYNFWSQQDVINMEH